MGRKTRSDSKGIQKIYRLIAVVAGLGLLLTAWPAAAQKEWDVTARSFVIMDAATGKILLENNAREMYPPASTIKVMTAMYVLDHLKLNDKVVCSRYAACAPASKINIKTGEEYTVKELLYALLLSSANDGARALAEAACGSEAEFTRNVTRMVRRWGAYRTKVATANGLPKQGQYSTAEDLAIIFRQAMQDPEFAEIISTKYYHIRGERELRNYNRFLWTTPLALGGKTGYTRASKHTYVGMFKNGDQAIIVSMMGSTKKWADLRTLIEKGFELSGAPIAKLEAKEERLRFARKHMGNSVKVTKKKSKKSRSYKKRAKSSKTRKKSSVSMSSLAGVPDKKSKKK